MKKRKNKKITLDDLARMTANGFSSIENKIDGLDSRMDGMENKMTGMENRMDGLDNRMDGMDDKIDELKKTTECGFSSVNARLDILEKDVSDIRQKLSIEINREEFFELEKRITIIEEELGIKY